MKATITTLIENISREVKGFTLIETFVAIVILMMAVVGPLSLASLGLRAALVASDQATATYLAADAIEYIRYTRDTNTLSQPAQPWLTHMNNCFNNNSQNNNFCRFDTTKAPNDPYYPSGRLQTCGGTCANLEYASPADLNDPTCQSLVFHPALNTYNYLCGPHTKFTRTVWIKCITPSSGCSINNATEVQVNASVGWNDGNLSRAVTLTDVLFNTH